MVKEGLKKILPVIQAFVGGKTIQRYDDKKDDWYDISPNANIDFCYDYRIKPEPKYRPFKNQEECWNEMLKHQPFGWIKEKNTRRMHIINSVSVDSVNSASEKMSGTYSGSAFDNYEFADGSPFGVKI